MTGKDHVGEAKPALTPEEWAAALDRYLLRDGYMIGIREADRVQLSAGLDDFNDVHGVDRQALAAVALHEQPFGFTWEDVDALRGTAEDYEYRAITPDPFVELNDLADRIAALLPPRAQP